MSFSSQEIRNLRDIVESVMVTNYGREWPQQYTRLYTLWGYFSQVYDTLYDDDREWVRIARFALDERFDGLSGRLIQNPYLQRLAELPCVADGRSNYEPQAHVRIAFHVLREAFGIPYREGL